MKNPKIKEAINLLAGKVRCKDCDHLYYNYGNWICKEHRNSRISMPSINFYRFCNVFQPLTEFNKILNIKKMNSVKEKYLNKMLSITKEIKNYE